VVAAETLLSNVTISNHHIIEHTYIRDVFRLEVAAHAQGLTLRICWE